MVKQRVGQQLFREGLLSLWNGRCCVITGVAEPRLLRASHTKPWADATDTERLDVYNGLLLVAHLDAAFDTGLISLSDAGTVLVVSDMDETTRTVLGLNAAPPTVPLAPQHAKYMA